MAFNLAPVIKQTYFDTNSNLLAGGKIYTYQAGTSTPQATYTDSSGATPNANPVILDAYGQANIWLNTSLSYKFVVKDSSDVLQYTTDSIIGLVTNNAVTTEALQDGSVTTAKLADDSVTSAKLADDASIDANRAVSTNHIKDGVVTRAKLATGATAKVTVTASKTTTYTATSSDDVIPCDATAGAFTVNLPTAVGITGLILVLKKTDSSFNQITIDGNGSETIDGSLTKKLCTQYEAVKIVSDGSNWLILERRIPSVWASFTDTLTGFGTATSKESYWMRVGSGIVLRQKFACGTPTAVEARSALPGTLTTADTSLIPTIQMVGEMVRSTSIGSYVTYKVLAEPSVGYVTFGTWSGTAGGLTKQNGSTFSDTLSFITSPIPVSGWEG